MKPVALFAVALACIACASCRQREFRTVTMECPKVKGAQAAEIVTKALSRSEGVMPETIRIEDGKVTVRYDSMKTAIKNLEFVVAEAGFDAGEIPADPKAREALPADLR